MSVWQGRRGSGGSEEGLEPVARTGAAGAVPARALVLSAAALALPVTAQLLAPGLAREELSILLWLPALVPAFLLTYYRGWRGASLSIAFGMAALTISQVVLAARRAVPPDWPVVLALVLLLMSVSLGIGWVGELLHRARRDAEELALVDPLTGLANRRYLAAYLEAAYAAAERGGRLSVVVFDVDGYGALCREQGQPAGESLLRVVAGILTRQTRRLDLTARLGGDEFVTVLTGTTVGDAMAFFEQMRAALSNERFPWGGVSLSAGIAAFGRGTGSPDALLAEADRALHRARELGPGQASVWEPGEQGGQALLAVSALEGAAAAGEGPTGGGGRDSRGCVLTISDGTGPGTAAIKARRLGFEVIAVAGAEALLERLRERGADVVLAGVVMPGMSGFTLADRIATDHPGVPVLLASRYDHQALSADRRPASVIGFLREPLELRELGVALEQAMADGRARRRPG